MVLVALVLLGRDRPQSYMTRLSICLTRYRMSHGAESDTYASPREQFDLCWGNKATSCQPPIGSPEKWKISLNSRCVSGAVHAKPGLYSLVCADVMISSSAIDSASAKESLANRPPAFRVSAASAAAPRSMSHAACSVPCGELSLPCKPWTERIRGAWIGRLRKR